MRWNSLFRTSPLLTFEKLKNIKAKLFFSAGTLQVIISSSSCLRGIGLTMVKQELILAYHASHTIKWTHFLLGYGNFKKSQTSNIIQKIEFRGCLLHQAKCYL